MSSKIDGFDGSASDYIRYLENIVRSFREPHPSCPICAPHRRTHHEPYQNTPSEPRREATPEQPKEYSPSLKRSPSIEIIEFDPKQELNEQPARSNKDRRISVPSWKERALLLIEETPAASAWTKKLKEIGIYDAMCSGKAVSSLLNWEFDSRPSTGTPVDPPTTQSQDSSPLVFAERYARISMQNEVAASVAMALANYQKFLVLSSCAVLVGTNTPAEDVYRIVRICMGNDASDKHCQRILRGCKFVNALLDRLYMGGWGLRAYELLLICKSVALSNDCPLTAMQGTKTQTFTFAFLIRTMKASSCCRTNFVQRNSLQTSSRYRASGLQFFLPRSFMKSWANNCSKSLRIVARALC